MYLYAKIIYTYDENISNRMVLPVFACISLDQYCALTKNP
jgi:hypothetical protein